MRVVTGDLQLFVFRLCSFKANRSYITKPREEMFNSTANFHFKLRIYQSIAALMWLIYAKFGFNFDILL